MLTDHKVIPFKRNRNSKWAAVCLWCCLVNNHSDLDQAVSVSEQAHKDNEEEIRVIWPPMDLTKILRVVL